MSQYKVFFDYGAEEDFDRIVDYLVGNDFNVKIARQIRDKVIKVLSERPLSGMIYDETRNVQKVLILRKNLVFYRIIGVNIQVLHIRAGKMSKSV